jgi:predicted short-subunit dehydrogenase-like oxidoreductase (DUF2520 family)
VGGCWYARGVERTSISIVGAGRFGTALAERLNEAGYSIPEIVVRGNVRRDHWRRLARKVGARLVAIQDAELTADVIWLCVPDAEISSAADRLQARNWAGKTAFHSSGVMTCDVLGELRERGGLIASVHPLTTFVSGSVPQLAGVPFAIEGDRGATLMAGQIVRRLHGRPIPIRKEDKIAYHTFATMVCPLLVSLLAAAERTAALSGISAGEARQRMMPILRQTLANYENLGPAKAFSGPIVRGDVETIRRHLEVVQGLPRVKGAYAALAQAALEFLPSRNRAGIAELLSTAHSAQTPRARRSKALNRRERGEQT